MLSAQEFLEDCNALTSGKSPLQILRETRELLSVPDRWTKGARARDASGSSVCPENQAAASWCLGGAIAIVCNPFGILPPSMIRLLDKVVRIIFPTEEDIDAGEYNELMNHEDILYLLDEAILIEEVKYGVE